MNFEMLRRLCDKSTLRNVVIVTNMWGEVDPEVGEARVAELMEEDIFFKPALEGDAQIARNENTATSAQEIIRLVLDNYPPRDYERMLTSLECRMPSDYRDERVRVGALLSQMEAEPRR